MLDHPEPDHLDPATAPGPTEWGQSPGVGPWDESRLGPVPDDPRYDPELLRDGDTRNVVDAVVTALEPHGPVVRVRTREGLSADLTPASVADLALEPGTPVRLAVKAAAVSVHAAPRTPNEGRRRQ